jgi:GNAT superfamily N-acetyltransferase
MVTCTIEEEPVTTALTEIADEGFRQQGLEATGFDEPITRVAFTAYDNNRLVGFVTANILWKSLHIRYMFIISSHRKMGIGSMLMKRAMDYGRSQGCTKAFVDTLSFQASGFYQKLGFVPEFSRTGLAHDVALHYLAREL